MMQSHSGNRSTSWHDGDGSRFRGSIDGLQVKLQLQLGAGAQVGCGG